MYKKFCISRTFLTLTVKMFHVVLLLFALANSGYAKKNIIVDLDGSVDSCQVIAYTMNAYHRGEIDVDFVISPSFGTAEDAVNNVFRCFEIIKMSRNVSIYLGSDNRISTDDGYIDLFGIDGFGDLHLDAPNVNYLRKTKAPVKIAELVADASKEYTYIANGVLTNLALAMTMYKHVAENIKSIHVVGGNFPGQISEAYFTADPEAVNTVLKRAKSPVKLLTLQNCEGHSATHEWRRSVTINNPYVRLLNRAERKHQQTKLARDGYDLCGALLISTVIRPGNLASHKLTAIDVNRCANHGYINEIRASPNVELIKINGDNYKKFFVEEFTNICKNYECSNKYDA